MEAKDVPFKCRCGHQWFPKSLAAPRPRVCPKCKSANWDRPYKFRRVQREGLEKASPSPSFLSDL